jgi:hypothetical protein
MKPVPDRKKLRREYLRKKWQTYAPVRYRIAILVTFLAIEGYRAVWVHRSSVLLSLLPLFAVVLAGVLWSIITTVKTARQQAALIPVVPPVTPSTLPAEEILVRGATEPSAPNETLLRATVKGEETKAQELLRSSQGTE